MDDNSLKLVEPSLKYKEAYLKAAEDFANNTDKHAEEFNIGKIRDGSLVENEDGEKHSYDVSSDKGFEENIINPAIKARKPVKTYWILKGDKLIGEIGVKARDLSIKDVKNGAKPYDKWESNGQKRTPEVFYAIAPSSRGGGVTADAMVLLYYKLKEMGVEQVAASVDKDNGASNYLQEEYVLRYCGGKKYVDNKEKNVYLSNNEPERLKNGISRKKRIKELRKHINEDKKPIDNINNSQFNSSLKKENTR